MDLSELQGSLRGTYYERDAKRGRDGTFRWLVEEIGELARAIRGADRDQVVHEFGDVLAWLTSLANLAGVDLEEAATPEDWPHVAALLVELGRDVPGSAATIPSHVIHWRDRTHAFYLREGWVDYGKWFVRVLDENWVPWLRDDVT